MDRGAEFLAFYLMFSMRFVSLCDLTQEVCRP